MFSESFQFIGRFLFKCKLHLWDVINHPKNYWTVLNPQGGFTFQNVCFTLLLVHEACQKTLMICEIAKKFFW